MQEAGFRKRDASNYGVGRDGTRRDVLIASAWFDGLQYLSRERPAHQRRAVRRSSVSRFLNCEQIERHAASVTVIVVSGRVGSGRRDGRTTGDPVRVV